MVNPAIFAAIAATNASMAMANRRRAEETRRMQEAARRRAAEEQRRRMAQEEERRRRRAQEEENRRRKEERKKNLVDNYKQKQKEDKLTLNSDVYEFTEELRVSYDHLGIVHVRKYDSLLADGSVLSNIDDKYLRYHPDGRVQEYVGSGYGDNQTLLLTREELPNGAMVVYEKGRKTYERDEEGNYTYHKYDSEGRLQEFLEGKYEAEEANEFSDNLTIKYNSLDEVHKGAYESILADGARMSKFNNKYTITHPNGRIQEFELNGSGQNSVLTLVKEELPNGAIVVYDNGKKIYEMDDKGNYTYHKTDYKGNLIETVNGNADLSEAKFTDKLELQLNAFDGAVYKNPFEQLLPDGNRHIYSGGNYQLKLPNGTVQQYEYYYKEQSDSKYVLAREELPNGATVVYKNGKKIYEIDEKGNYVYHKQDKSDGVSETIEGNAKEDVSESFTDKLVIRERDLEVIHKGLSDTLLADGGRMNSSGNKYEIRYPNGRQVEYTSEWRDSKVKLVLTREELPNGAMVVYKKGQKTYERDSDGKYVFNKSDHDGKLQYKIEGDTKMWKRTVYDKEGNVSYYVSSEEPNKKYYPSGKLFEEVKQDGSCFMYAENGICLYEYNGKEYNKYQLTADGKDRMLVEKGSGRKWSERYVYYPSGQVKEEYFGGKYGDYRMYSEGGICLTEKENGHISEYQSTPDGKDRLLIRKTDKWNCILEQHEYYPSGKIKESTYSGGEQIKYNEDGTYQKFDKYERLKEETTSSGRTVYAHYADTTQIEHIAKYDLEGKAIASEYKHFDKEGKEDTAYYLALKRLIARKIEKADQKQAKKGIPPEERKVSKKMSKTEKFFAKIEAKIDSRGK